MRSRWWQALGLAASFAFFGSEAAHGQEANEDAPPPLYEGLEPRRVSLQECLEIALANQPRIHAELSSQESAAIQARFLNRLKPLATVQPALGARIDQANLGLNRAKAAVDMQVEETFYAVRRAYFTHIYARRAMDILVPLDNAAQRTENALDLKRRIGGIASLVVDFDGLKEWLGTPFVESIFGLPGPNLATDPMARKFLKSMEWSKADDRLMARLRFAHAQIKKHLNEAEGGLRQSVALLGEEMGGFNRLGYQPIPSATTLPMANPRLSLPTLLDLLDENSGELIQIRAGRAAMELELKAQKRMAPFRGLVGTFGVATDTKTVPLPTPDRGEDFRPAVVGFEIPANLAGPRRVRLARANALVDRARSVEESTRNLLRLQMRVTFENYVDIQQDIGHFERDAGSARELFKEQTGGLLSAEEGELLNATANLINDLEKAHLVRAILLADLIRQTGGALAVDIDHWDVPPATPQPPAAEPLPGEIIPNKNP